MTHQPEPTHPTHAQPGYTHHQVPIHDLPHHHGTWVVLPDQTAGFLTLATQHPHTGDTTITLTRDGRTLTRTYPGPQPPDPHADPHDPWANPPALNTAPAAIYPHTCRHCGRPITLSCTDTQQPTPHSTGTTHHHHYGWHHLTA